METRVLFTRRILLCVNLFPGVIDRIMRSLYAPCRGVLMMMIVRCGSCGREVQWKDGAEVGKLEVECAGSTVICTCGAGVSEDGGVLREFHVPDAR